MSWQTDVRHIHERVVKAWPPYSETDARFLTLALAGEVGELANLIKKRWRGDWTSPDAVRDELADVRIYLELLALALGVDLDDAVEDKLPALYDRWPEAKP